MSTAASLVTADSLFVRLPDTLMCDSARLAVWRVHSDYDYNRELVAPDVDLMELISRWMVRLLNALFGSRFATTYTEVILVIVAVLLLIALLWFLYRQRPELFQRTRRNQLPYCLHEDTIYGVDFEGDISVSLHRSDYREAIRLLYLQTLKQLSDAEQIDWQPYKTPTEYIYEMKIEALRMPFRELTNSFLRVRYGNFEATEELFHHMKHTQQGMAQPKGGAQ